MVVSWRNLLCRSHKVCVFALYGTWKALVSCNKLAWDVGDFSPRQTPFRNDVFDDVRSLKAGQANIAAQVISVSLWLGSGWVWLGLCLGVDGLGFGRLFEYIISK